MRSTRSKITHLKNKISENLPDTADILGYAGISKTVILDSLSDSYDILAVLEEYNDKFETIFAKRSVAELIDSTNHYLNDIWGTDNATAKFNEFLNYIAQIRFILKDTYLSLNNNPLRLESEIIKAKEQLLELSQDLDQIKAIKSEIDTIKNDSAAFIDELEAKHTLSIENEKKINDFVDSVESIDEELTGTNEKIKVWKSEIQTIKEDISNKQAEIIKLKTETEQVQTKNKDNQILIDKFKDILDEQLSINKTQQDYIQKTIEDVSRAGMAGSFKKRKDELKWLQFAWAFFTILSIAGLLIISYNIIKPLMIMQNIDIVQLYIKIPVFASAVWLGWFCAKQYGFTSRIMEDYSFKYAISMAFEGFKKETQLVDEELQQKLLELTILNISKNPVSNFDSKSNHGTPYNEMFESLTKRFFNKNDKTE